MEVFIEGDALRVDRDASEASRDKTTWPSPPLLVSSTAVLSVNVVKGAFQLLSFPLKKHRFFNGNKSILTVVEAVMMLQHQLTETSLEGILHGAKSRKNNNIIRNQLTSSQSMAFGADLESSFVQERPNGQQAPFFW